MPLIGITAPPDAPSRADDGDTFSSKADAFVAWLETLVTELNNDLPYIDDLIDDAMSAGLEDAEQNAIDAAASATAAASSAESAANADAQYPVETDSGTSYNVADADGNKYRRMTNAAAKTVTAQPQGTEALQDNYQQHFRNAGAGDLTFVEGTGVTINPPVGGTLIVNQHGTVTLKYVGGEEFDLIGQTQAA